MSTVILSPVLGTAVPSTLGIAVLAGVIRKFTKCIAYNSTVAVVPIKVFIVPPGAAADDTTCVVDYDLAPRETYLCPEVIGTALIADGTIQIQGLGVSFSAVASDTSTQ